MHFFCDVAMREHLLVYLVVTDQTDPYSGHCCPLATTLKPYGQSMSFKMTAYTQ